MRDQSKSKFKKDEVALIKAQLARALADYDNLRKRTELEKELWVKFSAEKVLIKLLPVLDVFESAQEHLKDNGLVIAIGEFKKILSEEGIVEIRPGKNDIFDPEMHEAVESISGGKKGHIADLVLTGWKFSDEEGLPAGRRVIRQAKVKVYGQKNSKEVELDKEMAREDL